MQGQVSPFRQNDFKLLTSVGTTKLPDLLVISQIGRDMFPTSEQRSQRFALDAKGLSTCIPHPEEMDRS